MNDDGEQRCNQKKKGMKIEQVMQGYNIVADGRAEAHNPPSPTYSHAGRKCTFLHFFLDHCGWTNGWMDQPKDRQTKPLIESRVRDSRGRLTRNCQHGEKIKAKSKQNGF